MWRDTIRYKYQLDKSQQLSEQEIEEKIDELERTMSESMPYFFDGKNDIRDENKINQNMGFISRSVSGGLFENPKHFISTMDDFQEWISDDTFLFCGNCADIYVNSYYPLVTETSLGKQDELGEAHILDERKKCRKIRQDVFNQLDSLRHYPLARYDKIMNVLRQLEKHNELDFTNLNVIKELFKTYQIYTYEEFFNQNGYEYDNPWGHSFILPDGQTVCWWGYKNVETDYYDE
jgi:hypothetical protein